MKSVQISDSVLLIVTKRESVIEVPYPCEGGVEYLHRDPASRKGRRNETEKKGRAIA
jgi:hypothetical protein